MKKFNLLFGFMMMVVAILPLSPVQADGPIEGRAGRAEVRYLEGMIDHHQMALDMAQDCLTKAITESVKTLCQNIIDAQSTEIETMQGWLNTWYGIDYAPMSMADHMSMMSMMEMMQGMSMEDMMGMMEGMDMSGNMMDMMMQMMGMMGGDMPGMEGMDGMGQMGDMPMMMGMMAGLNQLEGVEYEIAWLEAMIDHHDDAVHMSERILEIAEHEELRTLAQSIIDAQTSEIEAMEGLITELSTAQ
ncbi:MAG: DUF305 domain-containing protein [Anaerolineae bacterium]|nr:MAG: DUF305 domain-containing protein [Anaerolineae bacterium]